LPDYVSFKVSFGFGQFFNPSRGGKEMIKTTFQIVLALMVVGLLASGALAGPLVLGSAQLDAVAAGGVQKVDGFVCPVITTDAVLNSPNGAAIGEGHYTIGGPDVSVPQHATNGNGTGTPPGPHAQPGDTDYTAIWKR
jgi:hypothetical protein